MKKINYEIHEFNFNKKEHITQAMQLLSKVFPSDNFTKEWWDWKYNRNPFGKPFGWFAKLPDKNNFIGIRLLWPWRFYLKEKSKLFYQALDTATDPNYGRIGIFSNLTRKAIKKMNALNLTIYNFPNSNSYPAYIKLGWQDLAKQKWQYYPVSYIKIILHLFKIYNINSESNIPDKFKIENYNFSIVEKNNKLYHSKWNKKNIDWRFKNHPIYQYYYFNYNNEHIIYKINITKNMKVAQIIVTNIYHKKTLKKFIKLLTNYNIDLISYNGIGSYIGKILNTMPFCFKSKRKINYVLKQQNTYQYNFKLELGDIDFF